MRTPGKWFNLETSSIVMVFKYAPRCFRRTSIFVINFVINLIPRFFLLPVLFLPMLYYFWTLILTKFLRQMRHFKITAVSKIQIRHMMIFPKCVFITLHADCPWLMASLWWWWLLSYPALPFSPTTWSWSTCTSCWQIGQIFWYSIQWIGKSRPINWFFNISWKFSIFTLFFLQLFFAFWYWWNSWWSWKLFWFW